jgi:GcrA cell cycle regulator
MHKASNTFDWNDGAVARLKALWAEGLSTSAIGERLNISKNAVIGKVHRLDLPARPSPIRKDGAASLSAQTPGRPRLARSTLPPLQCPATTQNSATPESQDLTPASPRASASQSIDKPSRSVGSRVSSCCWPVGEPGTPSFRFCEADSVGGRPYCEAHCSRAYVKRRRPNDGEQEAA